MTFHITIKNICNIFFSFYKLNIQYTLLEFMWYTNTKQSIVSKSKENEIKSNK